VSAITPLGDRVLVELAREDETSPGGLFIVRDQKNKPGEGVVIAVGPLIHSVQVRVGARVVFPRYVGHEFTEDGKTLLVVETAQILGIVRDGESAADLPENVVMLTRSPGPSPVSRPSGG
jgi:chaperonin GroES